MKAKRILCLILAAALAVTSLAACSENTTNPSDSSDSSASEPADNSGDESSDSTTAPEEETKELVISDDDEEIYDQALGEFYETYAKAKEADSVAERFALMAIAEAKMLESGVMIPTQANGGNYAISKVAPYTISPVLWGNDSNREHNALVCTEPITTEDRDALKALYAEKKGTGTYEAEAKKFLEEKGYELQRTYSKGYSSDPQTLDIFMSSKAVDVEVMVNTFDGLIEYNDENELTPALAESWEVSDDGLTYTFKLRQGVKWVDSTGAEIGEVTADDFLAGFQHMLDDPTGGLSWLVDGLIVGVHDYIDPESENYTEDFGTVGVKAVDDYTVEYTLTQPANYFETMFGYSVFAPLNRAYYESLGGKFGFANNDSGTYGTSKDTVAYCGPYIISSMVANNTIVFEKNDSYWNKDNINLDKITWIYIDTQTATDSYDKFKQGVIDGCGLNSAALALAKEDGNFEKYSYVASTDASTFPGFFNLKRVAFANYNDETKLVSAQTDEMKELTHAAMQSQNFRLALALGFDRPSYVEQAVGSDLKLTRMVNAYTPGTFVTLPEEVTVSINGTDKTYPAGTFYGQIVQDQIAADGYPMKVFDPSQDGGIGSSAGYDGWYNVDEAKKYLEKAVEELAAAGYEISAENPVHIDYPYQDDGDYQTAQANVVKTSIEKSTDGLVVVDLIATTDSNEYLDATYYYESADQANYDLQLNSGWSPDYGDPSTYLDTMVKGGGYMLKALGLLA